jgi:hypothetical protein
MACATSRGRVAPPAGGPARFLSHPPHFRRRQTASTCHSARPLWRAHGALAARCSYDGGLRAPSTQRERAA